MQGDWKNEYFCSLFLLDSFVMRSGCVRDEHKCIFTKKYEPHNE